MMGSVPASMRCTCSSARMTGLTNSVNNTSPGASKLVLRQSPGLVLSRSTRTTAARPSGTLTRKIDRQPKACVRYPPATGPNVLEATETAAR